MMGPNSRVVKRTNLWLIVALAAAAVALVVVPRVEGRRRGVRNSMPSCLVHSIGVGYRIQEYMIMNEVGKDWFRTEKGVNQPILGTHLLYQRVFRADECRDRFTCDTGASFAQRVNWGAQMHLAEKDDIYKALFHGFQGYDCYEIYGEQCRPTLQEPFKSWSKEHDEHVNSPIRIYTSVQ